MLGSTAWNSFSHRFNNENYFVMDLPGNPNRRYASDSHTMIKIADDRIRTHDSLIQYQFKSFRRCQMRERVTTSFRSVKTVSNQLLSIPRVWFCFRCSNWLKGQTRSSGKGSQNGEREKERKKERKKERETECS